MSFPMVALGEVLSQYKEYIEAPEPKIYPKLSVKLYGKGVVLDTPTDGSSLKMKRHQIAKSGQVILSEIWGKKGAIGFVPPEGDGALCTSHFFLFDIDYNKIEPKYLQLIFTANYLQDQLDAGAKGTTGYAAVRPRNLLAAKIPLPSLSEQRRLVARIEEVAAKIKEAWGLWREAEEETKTVIPSVLGKMFNEGTGNRFKYHLIRDAITEHKQGYYNSSKFAEGDVYFARITDITNDAYLNYAGMPRVTIDDETLDSFRVQPNDFLFARTGGAGRFAIATKELKCIFASYLIRFRFKPDYIPKFLRYYFGSPRFQEEIRSSIHGGANQNIHAEDIKKATIPILHETDQRRIIAYLDSLQAKVDELRRLQAESGAELEAMMPAVLDKAFKGEL